MDQPKNGQLIRNFKNIFIGINFMFKHLAKISVGRVKYIKSLSCLILDLFLLILYSVSVYNLIIG